MWKYDLNKNLSLPLTSGDGDRFTKKVSHLKIVAIYGQGKGKSKYLTL